jgi:hypothetical protein
MERQFALMRARVPAADAAAFYRYLGWWSRRANRHGSALRFFARAALQRNDSYVWREFVSDVRYVVRERANDLRARTVGRLVTRSRVPAPPPALTPWQADAQAWIDELRRANPHAVATTSRGRTNEAS